MNASVFLKGDVIASPDRVLDPVISFPRTPFSTAGTAAALARLSIYATARLKVQKLPCSLGRAQECRAIAWKEMRFERTILSPRSKFLHRRSKRTSRVLSSPKNRFFFCVFFNVYIKTLTSKFFDRSTAKKYLNIFLRLATCSANTVK